MYDILSEEDIKKCSMFLINFIYADKTSLTISQARSKKWKAMKNKQHCAFHQTKIRLSNTCLGQTIKLKYGTILQTLMPPQIHQIMDTHKKVYWYYQHHPQKKHARIWSMTKHLSQTMTNQMTMAIPCVIVLHLMTIRQFLLIFSF